MAQFTITVNLDLTATPKVTVNPSSLDIPFGTHTIQWVLGTVPTSGTTVIDSFVDWLPHDPLNPGPTQATSFTGTDHNNNLTGSDQHFTYDVVLRHNDELVPRDPEIVNDPGTGPMLHHKSK